MPNVFGTPGVFTATVPDDWSRTPSPDGAEYASPNGRERLFVASATVGDLPDPLGTATEMLIIDADALAEVFPQIEADDAGWTLHAGAVVVHQAAIANGPFQAFVARRVWSWGKQVLFARYSAMGLAKLERLDGVKPHAFPALPAAVDGGEAVGFRELANAARTAEAAGDRALAG
jgi:hypothetical protein